MTNTASRRVSERFAARAEDWLPAPERAGTRVLFVPLLSEPQALEDCRAVISRAELQRSTRFLRGDDGDHFVQRRAFRRYCASVATGSSLPLSEIGFDETDKGHPFLHERRDLWFSFSSCRVGFLGAWSSTHAIGVDLEDQAREVEAADLANRFFTPAEAHAVAGAPSSAQAFLKLWNLKEAALKSIGEGLPYGLAAFAFESEPTLRLVSGPTEYGGADAFTVHLLIRPDIYAAIVTRERKKRIR